MHEREGQLQGHLPAQRAHQELHFGVVGDVDREDVALVRVVRGAGHRRGEAGAGFGVGVLEGDPVLRGALHREEGVGFLEGGAVGDGAVFFGIQEGDDVFEFPVGEHADVYVLY